MKTDIVETPKGIGKKALHISGVMWRLFGWLYPKCNHCKNGRLQKIDIYHHGKNMNIDIYRCNKCKNRVGVNGI